VSVQSTPVLYQIFFLYPFVSNIASPNPGLDFIPGFEVTDIYEYYKNTDEQYHQAGFAVTLAGIPLPIKYDDPEVLLKFPSNYGDIDSSFSAFELGFPDLGFYSMAKNRKNYVDGWGTLITPFGTFDTQRIRSEIVQSDSLYIDSLGIGFPINRQYIEYKWMGLETGIPLLSVREELDVVTIQYQDSLRLITGVKEITSIIDRIEVYPNPCSDRLNINMFIEKSSSVNITVLDMAGQETVIYKALSLKAGGHDIVIDVKGHGFSPGMYLLHMSVNGESIARTFVVQ